MAKRRIFCDGRELILLYDGNQHEESLNLLSNEIARIQFSKCFERKFLFLNVPTEKIEIKPSKLAYSITYTRSRAKELFDQYIVELTKYAQDNKVTFYNNL